ncbi:hypothetical protein ACQR1I_09230 [Bradyrhizobium sp. HKCCYLS2038]|uniref:hypothetical protein n=1 Tax=unclassified Bradyrhizobium TaxID=2631580 RepID=UPI003EBF184F
MSEFSDGYSQAAWARSDKRVADRARRERKREEERLDGMFERRRAETDAAYEACLPGGNPTDEQRALVRKADDAVFFLQRHLERNAQQPAASDRIKNGYLFAGGIVGGKYWQKAFVERGLRSWWHPFLQRFIASCGRASKGDLRTGPTKDSCEVQWSKLHGLDQPYGFFCDNCKDMFRLDVDRSFDSEDALRAWIAWVVKEFDLPCAPHVASWIVDDRYPGMVINPQLWILLPEGHAVWNDKNQHRMLGQIAAALTKAFGADPGGLAFLHHGKNPISPHCGVAIIQDTHMPTLSEWAESLDLTWDPVRMARELMRDRLADAGFDASDSNTYFTYVSKACREAAKMLFKQGFDISDPVAFTQAIAKIAETAAAEEIAPAGLKARQAVDKLVECCSRWAAHNFDPAKMDKGGRDRGAASHLMRDGDDVATRERKGQAYSANVRVEATRAEIVRAIRAEMRAGREPTIASIARATGRAYNTIKAHLFTCYVTVIASDAIQDLVKGVNNLPAAGRPSQAILETSLRSSQMPQAWTTPALDDHFRRQALIAAQSQRRNHGRGPSDASLSTPGKATLDFLASGVRSFHRSAVPVLRAA